MRVRVLWCVLALPLSKVNKTGVDTSDGVKSLGLSQVLDMEIIIPGFYKETGKLWF